MSQSAEQIKTSLPNLLNEHEITDRTDRTDRTDYSHITNELLSEFSFKTEHDKAAALSGILTAAIRSTLRLAPMMHVSAHQIGSGKSFLCELLTLFATPEKSTPHSFPSDDDEMKKMLLAELLTAPAVIEFDNLTTDLIPHKSLCTVLTSENISGRILGQSKTAIVGTRALFLSSGNNVDPVRDMTRRTVTINLDPECETPATREFKKNPVNDVAEKRGEFISAALTIIRAWIVAGKPITAVKGKRYRCKLNTLADVKAEMAKVYRESRSEVIDSVTGTKLVWMLQAVQKAIEGSDLEKRIEILEQKK